uniref:Uncharacterized protein n=1 Tax=Rhizophora mucronata TaxID=61149 RepID=A0A2P2NUT9_RHIMU
MSDIFRKMRTKSTKVGFLFWHSGTPKRSLAQK